MMDDLENTFADTNNTGVGEGQGMYAQGDGEQPMAQEETPSILGMQQSAAGYDFSSVAKEFDFALDGEMMSNLTSVFSEASKMDNPSDMANFLLKTHINEVQAIMAELPMRQKEQDYAETRRYFGDERLFNERVSKAGTALQAIEKKVPEIRAVLDRAGVSNNLHLINALALVGEMVGESGNFMYGGGGTQVEDTAGLYFRNSK